jgi:hypothetical protein
MSSVRRATPNSSSVSSTQHGKDIDRETGNLTTARGSSAADTTATAFQTTVTLATLAPAMGSSSSASRTWLSADIPAFNTVAIGSALLTHGPAIGQITGTRPTTFTWSTRTTGITCTTAGILVSAWRSAFLSRSHRLDRQSKRGRRRRNICKAMVGRLPLSRCHVENLRPH